MLRLREAGAPIVTGADAGVSPIKPHDAVRHAVPQMVFLGLSPYEALRSATSLEAEVCGLAHRKGRLAVGYDADILAVDGDPLTDPNTIHDIKAVYVRGAAVR